MNKLYRFSPLEIGVFIVLILVVVLTLAGCSAGQWGAVQDVAGDVAFVTGGDSVPTTQPTAALKAVKSVVGIVAGVVPGGTAAEKGVNLIAGAILALATLASNRLGRRAGRNEGNAALREVADDILLHTQPHEPYSPATIAALESVGRDNVARVEPEFTIPGIAFDDKTQGDGK